MFAVLNMETGDFYSKSPILKREAEGKGQCWNNTSVLPNFAYPFARYKDALRCSQKLSDRTGCICAVLWLEVNGAGR
jgi:hypothetical protein